MNNLERLEADIEWAAQALKQTGATPEALEPDSLAELPKPPVRHCSCGAEVVGAWDDTRKRYRWFTPTPRRGQFLIRQKPLEGWGTPWQAIWWGPRGGAYSVHECGGRVVDGAWGVSIDPDGAQEFESYDGVA